MIGQLRELFLNYGPICELWFDGGWDRPVKDWDLPRVYAEVKKMQPNCAVGVNHTVVDREGSRKHILPDSMLVDNKYYLQYFPTDFRLWDPKIAHKLDKKQYLYGGNSYYLPFEHTVCISKEWNWFQKNTPKTVRSLDELEELFYWCTSGNNTFGGQCPSRSDGAYPRE
jgi:alpha-L-fucosidase